MTTTSVFRSVPPPRAADNTCGFMPFPVTTLRFPVGEAFPLRCLDPGMACSTSGSYKGCFSTIPTTCHHTSTLARRCAPGEMCCGPEPYTACWTWLSMKDARTFSLFLCDTASGIGTLMPDSIMAGPSAGTGPLSTTNLPSANTDTTATASSAGSSTTTTGGPVATETELAVPGPTSQTSGGGREASLGAVVGSIVGALALLGMLLGAALFVWIRSRKKGKRGIVLAESITPVTGPDGIIMVPYRSGTSAPAPPSYDGRTSGGTESDASESFKTKPPRRPARSSERKINVTEGGWI